MRLSFGVSFLASLLVGDFDRMETDVLVLVMIIVEGSLLVGDFDRMETN